VDDGHGAQAYASDSTYSQNRGTDGANAHVSQTLPQTAKGSAMKKRKTKKKAAPKKAPRKDAAQIALSIVERVTGGKLKAKKKRR
jgi:hypothetical protein